MNSLEFLVAETIYIWARAALFQNFSGLIQGSFRTCRTSNPQCRV
jgi:hypothetical protein